MNKNNWRGVITISFILVGFYMALNAANTSVPTSNSPSNKTDATTSPSQDPVGTVPPGTTRSFTGEVEGVVQSIDQSKTGARVRVRDNTGQVNEFTLENNSMVFQDGKRAPVSNLRTGDRVTFQNNSTIR